MDITKLNTIMNPDAYNEQTGVNNDNLNVIATFVENTYDNCVVEEHQCKWSEFCQLLSQHVTTLVKEQTMMVIPAGFKNINDDYEFATTKDGLIKYRSDGKPHIRRSKKNIKNVYMLPLDFDGGVTLEEAEEKFSEYEYFAYTSSGHKSKRKEYQEAFRMFIPFKEPLTAEEYEKRGRAFRDWIGQELDQSSVDVARGFFIPSYLHEDRNNGHRTWRNRGKLLDAKTFEEEEIYVEAKPVIRTGAKFGEVKGKVLWNTIDVVALFKDLGLYKDAAGYGKHNVKCPWVSEHSEGIETGTVIYDGSDLQKPAFCCKHHHCVDRKLYDVTMMLKEQNGWKYVAQFCEVAPYDNEQHISKLDEEIQQLEEALKRLKSK